MKNKVTSRGCRGDGQAPEKNRSTEAEHNEILNNQVEGK